MLVDRIGGKRMLRLDYGYNIKTKTIDFHWNQKGVAESFGISNHTPAGQMGEAIYKGARYFKWGGRVLLVAAAIADGYSVVTSDRPWRQLAIVTGGWTGAWAGCKAFGAIGAAIGTAAEPGGGTAIGGAVGCFAGSLGGYWAGKTLVTMAVDNKAAENVGRAVEELLAPPSSNVDVSSSDNACWNPPPVCSPSVGVYTP
jgi:phage tail tape-measure protein